MHKDYIGSILAISDEAGNKLEQRHFDAWGNFTHLQIGNGAIITDKNIIDNTSLLLERGYTSHEHFAEVGIIHMNGRLYDPLLRRFLNADENIQDPYNTQNYNKYGYVMNNPLMFNDPSGEFWQFLAIPIVKALIFAVVSYTAITLITGSKFNILNLYSSIVMGLISAGITTVIGDVFSTATASIGNEALKSLVHAGAQGTLSFMQGGNFFTAAASAFLSSAVSFGYGQAAGVAAYNGVSQVALGMLSGGVGSTLTGGNFWEGVKIGGIVALFNHAMHRVSTSIEYKEKLTQFLKTNGVDPSKTADQATLDKYKTIFKEYWDQSAQWANFADTNTIAEWEKGDNSKLSITTRGVLKHSTGGSSWGITNSKGEVILAPGLLSKTNYRLASIFIHEMRHSIDYVSGFYKTFWQLPNISYIMEYRAYFEQYKWTGTMDAEGINNKMKMGYVSPFLLIK